jgi:hypothetical protein
MLDRQIEIVGGLHVAEDADGVARQNPGFPGGADHPVAGQAETVDRAQQIVIAPRLIVRVVAALA